MRTSILLFALAPLAMATAIPDFYARQVAYIACSGTTGNAQCCATDVLGLADLDCANRTFASFCLLVDVALMILHLAELLPRWLVTSLTLDSTHDTSIQG